MKIAIFHNLKKGGALNYLINTIKILKKKNTIDIYSFENNVSKKIINKLFLYKLKKTNNSLSSMFQILFELKKIHKKIAKTIKNKPYDLVLVFPSLLTQSPYLLKNLNEKIISIYIFTEPKREFYEKTHYTSSIKNIINKIIRLPIKYIDKNNCQHAKIITTISHYSSNILQKKYKKQSYTVHPGIKTTKPKIKTINKINNILSVGALIKIKGHDFSIKQISKTNSKFTILGRKNSESETILKLIKNNPNITLIHTENNKIKNKIYKKHKLYLANQNKEPFGLTTLEATHNNCYVIGKNEGGTPEIIKHGLNGFLYPNQLEISQKILKQKINQKKIKIYQSCKIDWETSTEKLLYLYHYLKNEPTE